MKVAALISGEPRFCEEFDHFLLNLSGYTKIDWFILLWENNKDGHYNGLKLVAPYWEEIERESAFYKIQNNLPEFNNLVKLSIIDKEQFRLNFEVKNKAGETHAPSSWFMFKGLQEVNKIQETYPETYDLVIRARPDISLDKSLDLTNIKHILDSNPRSIVVPNNHWNGYSKKINDMMAIANPEVMKIYCQTVDTLVSLQEEGNIYHPETMLAEHLARSGVNVIKGDFGNGLRHLGANNDQGIYQSKFGRWE